MGIWEEIKSFLLPQELELPTLLHTQCEFLNFELKHASIDFELELWASVDSVFLFYF
jgi:hypothetical protein